MRSRTPGGAPSLGILGRNTPLSYSVGPGRERSSWGSLKGEGCPSSSLGTLWTAPGGLAPSQMEDEVGNERRRLGFEEGRSPLDHELGLTAPHRPGTVTTPPLEEDFPGGHPEGPAAKTEKVTKGWDTKRWLKTRPSR